MGSPEKMSCSLAWSSLAAAEVQQGGLFSLSRVGYAAAPSGAGGAWQPLGDERIELPLCALREASPPPKQPRVYILGFRG